MKKGVSIVMIVVLTLLTLAGCGSAESKTIKIALAAPLTGDYAEYGTGFENAVKLMASKYNSQGGVLGKQIEIISFDDKNSGEEAASIAEKIASDDSISAVIGHFASGVCMAASPTYQEVGIVEISPSASHPDYSSEGDYIFRYNSLIDVEAAETLNIASEVFGASKVGILAVKTDWGTTTANIITEDLIGNYPDLEISGYEEVVDGTVDFSPAVTALAASGADTIIVVAMYNTLGPFVTQYKDVNPDINIVGFSNAYSERLIELANEDAEGISLPCSFVSTNPDPDVVEFVTAYEEAYGSIPGGLTAQAYDALGMLLTAIENVGSTERSAIKEELSKITYEGVTGDTKFNELGDAIKTYTWLKIDGGEFKVIE